MGFVPGNNLTAPALWSSDLDNGQWNMKEAGRKLKYCWLRIMKLKLITHSYLIVYLPSHSSQVCIGRNFKGKTLRGVPFVSLIPISYVNTHRKSLVELFGTVSSYKWWWNKDCIQDCFISLMAADGTNSMLYYFLQIKLIFTKLSFNISSMKYQLTNTVL